ncbi:hypothetical protein [Roseateles amylovorans]|uniref:DNA repair protein n=1 Tax=Roseateles amylovorans TaxID=2978473 RepID=A0ABY6AWQ8_9BURK|nr:hypothetical protein [Roseateles amylovorans]UXH77412.1 hypothetical protein N4261_20775 [Roseateles amylovorans]
MSFARMHRRLLPPLLATVTAMTLAVPAMAQQSPSMEERLRTQLRATTVQLQSAQNELAALKAAGTARPTAPVVDHSAEVAALRRELAQSRAELARERDTQAQGVQRSADTQSAAQAAVERAATQVGQFREAYNELLKLARASEAESQRLTAKAERQALALTQCQAQNDQLYAVGRDVLKAYESLDPKTVLEARQPFAAKARVRYDEITQQYGDRLHEGRFDARAVQESATAGGQ